MARIEMIRAIFLNTVDPEKTKSRRRRDLCSQLVLVTQTLPYILWAPVSIFVADHQTDHQFVRAPTYRI